ncbi:MAG: hydantoin racemase [Mycobacterium sp.]|nr:hydantoin racemase [Mycobacterium sp.]
MRIWLQKHVVEGRMPALDQWYRTHIGAVVDPGTEVVIHTLPRRAYEAAVPYDYVTFGAVAVHFNHYFARTAVQAERDGFDAWVIAAGQDPGLTAARTLATIPTLGYGSVSFHHCLREEMRFGLIGFAAALREPIVANVTRYRAEHLLASYSVIPGAKDAVVSAIAGDPDVFLGDFTTAAARAADEGAQVIIPAEGLPAEILWHYGIRELSGLPVLDPLGMVLKAAENEVRLRALGCVGRPTTGFGYARPPEALIEHIESVFAANEIEGAP